MHSAQKSGRRSEAAETERAGLAVHDEPLHPTPRPGRLDVEVQYVAVAVAAGPGDGTAEGGRERLGGMARRAEAG